MVRLPARLTPRQAGPGWLLATRRDDDGVESVVLLRLELPWA